MQWYIKCFKNYTNFNGRARRKEYWMFILFNIIFSILATILDSVLDTPVITRTFYRETGIIYILYSFIIFIPSLAVTVRRLHDIGKSGWWYFIIFIPLVGAIWMLILMCTEGQCGDNLYGPDPKNTVTLNNSFITE
ncbi:MAG TPA: DUF805 domain-containing protein [Clostridiales bacterium]|nr:MAG: hypothetical protein A2Y40_02330 [Candidatus Margulisbacteria bacterium GWF2_35_9]HAN21487.1 DUF805 domain-containing protein [Clostridiales bacterium]